MKETRIVDELISRCKECKFATCEQCEINWNEIQAIEKVIRVLQIENSQLKADMKTNYINKTKIEEKIESCKKQYAFYNDDKRKTKNIAKIYDKIIEVLVDLLMEE